MTESHPSNRLIASRYRVERELGRGGMSTVYLAEDLKHGRKVALKVMREDLGLTQGGERFAREIELTAALTHPHILPLLDSGKYENSAFYAMPYIAGESLRDLLIRERNLEPADALRIAREVADALAYAHAHNVVHRDIKPENILISAGHAVVADFGVARAISAIADESVTQVGVAIGTPTYMSPEQAMGDPIDGRTDIYALGCVLFEMLTGDAPYHGSTPVARLARKITGVIPDLTGLRGALPDGIEAVVRRMLARDADDRFQSADELLRALDGPTSIPTTLARNPAPANNALAVMAFVNMSPNAEDDYLGEGISEELMHALTRLGGLRLVARTSAFAFKNSGLDVREIGRRLRVRRIVEGSVRRAGTRMRVTAQLVDADSAIEIWSDRFDRHTDDLFAVEDEIGSAVARTLKELLVTESGKRLATNIPPERSPASSIAAYDHYLKGRHAWSLRSESGLRDSAEHLRRALAADPTFALAHAALADTLATIGLYGMARPLEVLPLAREAAERALALDRGLGEALAARACVRAIHDWDWSGAEDDFARAIVSNPQYPTAHQWYAMHCLVPQRRFAEARGALEVARDLDPLSLTIAVSIAAAHYYERRYDDAIGSSEGVLAIDPEFAMGHFFLGLAHEQAGRMPEALSSLEAAVRLSGSTETQAALAHAHVTAGDAPRARAMLAALEEPTTQRYDSPVARAQVHVALGEPDRALALLAEAQAVRAADLMWLSVRPTFDPLRSHPAFVEVLSSLHLPA